MAGRHRRTIQSVAVRQAAMASCRMAWGSTSWVRAPGPASWDG